MEEVPAVEVKDNDDDGTVTLEVCEDNCTSAALASNGDIREFSTIGMVESGVVILL